MRFNLPYVLLGLLAVPVLVAAYLWQLRRRRRAAIRFSHVALLRKAVPRQRSWRRHVPIAMVLAALGLLALAGARPQVRAQVPVSSSAVILAIDVSGSMCSTDVSPNRMSAAQDAVRKFVDDQNAKTRIGLVVFSGFAQLSVAPTTDHEELLTAVDGLTTGRGTAIGAAILKSIDAVSEINPQVAPSDPNSGEVQGDPGVPDGPDQRPTPTPSPSAPSAPGAPSGQKAPEIVVLLTDGANTRGVTPESAAEQAAQRGVRVYPIGFGTSEPTQMVCTSEQLGGGMFDGPPQGLGGLGFGARNFLVVDEDSLRQVASTTGGEYFKAEDAEQLNTVFKDLPQRVDTQERDVDVSVAFAGLAALVLLLALWLGLRWAPHPQ
jgi:Ca-activated chloride channel family protein